MRLLAIAYEKPVGVVVKQVSLESLVTLLHFLPSDVLMLYSLINLLL
jgi:hypothetical protein